MMIDDGGQMWPKGPSNCVGRPRPAVMQQHVTSTNVDEGSGRGSGADESWKKYLLCKKTHGTTRHTGSTTTIWPRRRCKQRLNTQENETGKSNGGGACNQAGSRGVAEGRWRKWTIRDRADDHRDRKCRETEDTGDKDFKIKRETRHQNPGQHDLQVEAFSEWISHTVSKQKDYSNVTTVSTSFNEMFHHPH